ncbi:MAG TPA: D-2-hydroxyacid dehydrogenase, partial [Tepidisphaeraceae bacterium]|nr:D-2-hydroxyacid dehydrogenase [Tepidisphaeraceae bacterium]
MSQPSTVPHRPETHTGHLTIWTNFTVLPADARDMLRRRAAPHRVIFSSQAPDPQLAQADIAFGQPDVQQVIDLPGLRWIQISTAGYTRYDRADVRAALRARGAIMTNASWVYDEPCAQHVLAMMLGLARQLPAALENQRTTRGWPSATIRDSSFLLNGQSVLLVGYGAIARRLAELLRPLGMKVTGLRRMPRGDEAIPVVPIDQIDRLLPEADHVVNILPASPETARFFDADRLARLKPAARFYNIGRGNTVDQQALRQCLQSGRLAAAYLDVTTPEPLPPDDPLWSTPNCYITPHSGGGHSG